MSTIQVSESVRKKRQACDNCHFSKVRCTGELSGCQRCCRGQKECHYGESSMGRPSADSLRRRRRSKAVAAQKVVNSDSIICGLDSTQLQLDWVSLASSIQDDDDDDNDDDALSHTDKVAMASSSSIPQQRLSSIPRRDKEQHEAANTQDWLRQTNNNNKYLHNPSSSSSLSSSPWMHQVHGDLINNAAPTNAGYADFGVMSSLIHDMDFTNIRETLNNNNNQSNSNSSNSLFMFKVDGMHSHSHNSTISDVSLAPTSATTATPPENSASISGRSSSIISQSSKNPNNNTNDTNAPKNAEADGNAGATFWAQELDQYYQETTSWSPTLDETLDRSSRLLPKAAMALQSQLADGPMASPTDLLLVLLCLAELTKLYEQCMLGGCDGSDGVGNGNGNGGGGGGGNATGTRNANGNCLAASSLDGMSLRLGSYAIDDETQQAILVYLVGRKLSSIFKLTARAKQILQQPHWIAASRRTHESLLKDLRSRVKALIHQLQLHPTNSMDNMDSMDSMDIDSSCLDISGAGSHVAVNAGTVAAAGNSSTITSRSLAHSRGSSSRLIIGKGYN